MTYEPPPIPRKPASYSPSFLAQHDADYFNQEQPLYAQTGDRSIYHDTYHPEHDEYDRDFSLDMHQSHRHSRPSSNGSAYGRPLPAPPGVGQLQMPALNYGHDYADAFEEYNHGNHAPSKARLSESSFNIPHSLSQSSVGSLKPLPEPPVPYTARSGRSPTRGVDTRRSFGDRTTHELLNYHSRFVREQTKGHFSRSSGGSNTISIDSDSRSYIGAPLLPASSQDDCSWNTDAALYRGTDLRHEADVTSNSSFSTMINFPENNYRIYDEPSEDQYWQSPIKLATAEHSRHTSQDVVNLSIPPVDPYAYHRDLYQDHYFQQPQQANFQDLFEPSLGLDRTQDYVQSSPVGSSTSNISSDPQGTVQQHSFHHNRNGEHNRQHNEHALPPPDSHSSTLVLQKTSVGSRNHSQGLPIHDLVRNSTSPLMTKSKAMADLTSHRARSNTASTIFEKRPPEFQIDAAIQKAPAPLTIPIKSSKTCSIELDSCEHPWSRSELFYWGRNADLKTTARFLESYSRLFRHAIPVLSSAIAYKTSYDLLQSYLLGKEISKNDVEPEMLIFSADPPGQGILPGLSNGGCYSYGCRSTNVTARCYSSRCSRSPNGSIWCDTSSGIDVGDWAQYWKLETDKEPLMCLDKREIQRQYQIHEVIHSETEYLGDLKVMRDVFHATLKPATTAEHDLAKLVFGHIPTLIELSELHLHSMLRNRQTLQGPMIESIGDIFQDWLTMARAIYVEYASNLKYADRAIRTQRLRNPRIKDWLLRCQQDPRVKKLDFFSFQGSPTRRMQRYALLLSEVMKKTPQDCYDYPLLDSAIQAIRSICSECDSQVKLAHDKISLMDLQEQLVWRVPQKDLALADSQRVIHHRSELQRKNESSTSWQMRDVILLDNFVLCVKSKDGIQKVLSRPPIPVDYLIVEDFSEVLYKSSSTRLLGGTITHAKTTSDVTLRRSTTEQTRSSLPDGPSSPGKSSSEDLYPFTIKHAGKPDDKMTFYADSASSRTAWLAAIAQARSDRWRKICFREPFEVSIIADHAFGRYAAASSSNKSSDTPASAVEHAVSHTAFPAPKCITMSRIQCSTMFRKPDNTEVYLVGTDDGIFTNYHGAWKRLAMLSRVSQIAMLEDFGVLTVLADKILIAYTIDDLLDLDNTSKNAAIRKPPQRLSGSKDVGFFEVGVLKDRMLVIYKKRENGNSVFKALEPVIGKKQDKRSFFKKGTGTDFFRDFDQFFIPAECYGMQYLRSTICIRCSRGFEIMSLDSKQPLTIPDLSGANTTSLRSRIEGARPLGTYRVQEGEFLCCYTECGLFVDKYGSICRPYTLEWEGRPTHAVLVGKYVLAIGKEFIEVWNIEKRSLRQVITGRDIRLVPHSSAGSGVDMLDRGVVIAMDNPANGGKQLLIELKLRNPQ